MVAQDADLRVTAPAVVRRFVEAARCEDPDSFSATLHLGFDFRALTPYRVWEAHDRDDVLNIPAWKLVSEATALDALVVLEVDTGADRAQVYFRFPRAVSAHRSDPSEAGRSDPSW